MKIFFSYINYTTTANFANVITLNNIVGYQSLFVRNDTGSAVELAFESSNDVAFNLDDGDFILLEDSIEFNTLRARYAAGGSGGAGLHVTAWRR